VFSFLSWSSRSECTAKHCANSFLLFDLQQQVFAPVKCGLHTPTLISLIRTSSPGVFLPLQQPFSTAREAETHQRHRFGMKRTTFALVAAAQLGGATVAAASASASASMSKTVAESADTLVTFFDLSQVAETDPALELRVQRPAKEGVVIAPTEPWESWAVFGYNSVVAVSSTDLRIYYDCIEGTGVPPGLVSGNAMSDRRVCLAKSTDGLTWTKPSLGVFNRNGSTANNIVVENSGVSVFIDGNPTAPASERFKMACSDAAYASPDGISWTQLPWTPIAEDDTKPTAYWDPEKQKYAACMTTCRSRSPTMRPHTCRSFFC